MNVQSPKSRIRVSCLQESAVTNKDCMRTCDTRYAIPKYSAQISGLRRSRSAWRCAISSTLGGQRMPRAGESPEHPIMSNNLNKRVIGCSEHSPAGECCSSPDGLLFCRDFFLSGELLIGLLFCRDFFFVGRTSWAACDSNLFCRCSLLAPSTRVCDALTRTRRSCRACAHANQASRSAATAVRRTV